MSIVLKNGQLKIQQMVFMLLALTLFFILVVLFFLVIKTGDLQKDKVNLDREKAIGLVTKIASTPEFNFEGNSRTVDMDKLMILQSMKEYSNFFGVNGIIV